MDQRRRWPLLQIPLTFGRFFAACIIGTVLALVCYAVMTFSVTIPDIGGSEGKVVIKAFATDVNPCNSTDNGGCGEHSTCAVGATGLIVCSCLEGYVLEPSLRRCSPATPPSASPSPIRLNSPSVSCGDNNGGCGSPAVCSIAAGSVVCVCAEGLYDPASRTCARTDPCLVNNGDCPANSECVHLEDGSAVCQCVRAYSLSPSGTECVFVDPCTINNGLCPPGSSCSYDRTSFSVTCTCGPGLELSPDRLSCGPVNPCKTNNGGCGEHSLCTPSGADSVCTCEAGYTGPGGRNCVLITADALPGEFMACSGLSADDVSFAVITGRDNYIPALKSTWMQYTPHALVLTTPGHRATPVDFVQALSLSREEAPAAKWYILSDDDTYFNLPNLLCYLATLNPSAPAYVGVHHCKGEGFKCQRGMPIMDTLHGWVNGGAGIVMSRALALLLDTGQCINYYRSNWKYHQNAADVVIACCVADYWQGSSIIHHPGFFREPPGPQQYECECGQMCTLTVGDAQARPQDVISFHHVPAHELQNIFRSDVAAKATVYENSKKSEYFAKTRPLFYYRESYKEGLVECSHKKVPVVECSPMTTAQTKGWEFSLGMSATCEARLKREIKMFFKDPVEHIIVCPSPKDIKEMNFVLLGPAGSPYEGGFYHGVVEFPTEYPFKPPQIKMFTPSGRFEVNKPLCLTMTNFHPESWNPMWSLGTILMGLLSFMLEPVSGDGKVAIGSIVSSEEEKRKFAAATMDFNRRQKKFCDLFPQLLTLAEEPAAAAGAGVSGGGSGSSSATASTVSLSPVPSGGPPAVLPPSIEGETA